MKIVGYILAACLLLAVVRSVIIAGLIVLAITLLWGIYFRPGETFGLLFTLLLYGLVGAHPLACIAFAAMVFLVIRLKRPADKGITGPDGDDTARLPPP